MLLCGDNNNDGYNRKNNFTAAVPILLSPFAGCHWKESFSETTPPRKKPRTLFIKPSDLVISWNKKIWNHDQISPLYVPISDIVVGQLFGIFPLSGIFDKDSHRIRLVWPTLRVILDLILLAGGIVNCVTEFIRLRAVGVNAKNINGLVFYVDGCIINVLFLQMATKWNRVAVKWDTVDRIFLTESYRSESKWTLKRRMWTAASVLIALACCKRWERNWLWWIDATEWKFNF